MDVGKATTPAMMVDPASGQLQCTKQGVLAAQVHKGSAVLPGHRQIKANRLSDRAVQQHEALREALLQVGYKPEQVHMHVIMG